LLLLLLPAIRVSNWHIKLFTTQLTMCFNVVTFINFL
jgi:hypothetical protein